jgi:hypothetical protein
VYVNRSLNSEAEMPINSQHTKGGEGGGDGGAKGGGAGGGGARGGGGGGRRWVFYYVSLGKGETEVRISQLADFL